MPFHSYFQVQLLPLTHTMNRTLKQNKQLSYLSLGIGVGDMLLDFYLTFGAKSSIAKAWSLLSLGRQLKSSLERYKTIKAS